MSRRFSRGTFDLFKVLEIGDFLQVRIFKHAARSHMPADDGSMAGGVDQYAACESVVGRGDFHRAFFEAVDLLDGRVFQHFSPGGARGVDEHLVERSAFDIERGRAGEQAVAEAETHGVKIIADAEFRPVLRQVWQMAKFRLQTQFLNQREITRQDRLTDMKAGVAVFFKDADAQSGAGQ